VSDIVTEKLLKAGRILQRPGSAPASFFRCALVLAALFVGLCQVCLAQDYDIEVPGQPPGVPAPKGVTLFQNVRIFDGTSPTLSVASNVLIRGNVIEQISPSPVTVAASANVQVISGNGRVLMPGLIDAHWHSFMAATPQAVLMTSEVSYLHLLARIFVLIREQIRP